MNLPVRSVPELAALLLARDPLPPLVPARVYDPTLTAEIAATDAPELVQIGLHLLNDDLETSHALAQAHEGEPLGDYWHAIIHRREGDYNNSRYWFGRVGRTPQTAEVYGPDPAAPAAFVERCRAAGRGPDAALQQFQRGEIASLLAAVPGQSI